MIQLARSHYLNQPYPSSNRSSGRHRSIPFAPESTVARNAILQLRRARRIARPFLPIIARAVIAILTALQLSPIKQHLDTFITPFLSRLAVLLTFVASILSVIFFDIRLFNFIVIALIFLNFLLEAHSHHYRNTHQRLASVCFLSTAILFSTLVGRRRSISKPSALRSSTANKGYYTQTLKSLRNIDVLEAGTRLQASLLALDYSLSTKVGTTAFFFTLPFAILFLFGYCTRRNGTILLLMLLVFAIMNENSPVLGFTFTKTLCTVSGALLGIFVGPGLLTIDEWLATARQLYY